MLTVPFLTDLDPQAAIKGSRSPLDIQPIWTRLGRHVVGNLTTGKHLGSRLHNDNPRLLFAERVAGEGNGDGDLAVFLRWEQLAAYARGGINNDWVFRGTERAQKNFKGGAKLRDSVRIRPR